jgi:serine/threonine-protein kinase
MDKMIRWTLLFVVLVIFSSGAVAVYTVFFKSSPDDVPMPSLRDKSVNEAVEEAKRLGLSVRIEQAVSSLPFGMVLAQYPEPGVRMGRDKAVILQISGGGTRRPVPNVRNLDLTRAQVLIREQGFDVGDVLYIKDDSFAAGFVIAQSPAAPANVPADRKIDLLVNQGGPSADGKAVIPDVAQMTERQARDLLTASGFKVPAVDYVYSPNATDGHVIGTRPAAGAAARAGEGVRLKFATTKRPDGVPAPSSPTTPGGSAGAPSSVSVVESAGSAAPGSVAPGSAASVIAASTQGTAAGAPRVIQNPALPGGGAAPSSAGATPSPAGAAPSTGAAPAAVTPPAGAASTGTPQPSNLQPFGGKIARIRYQVPPLSSSLRLKIEMVDPSGTKVLVDRDAKSGEYVSIDAPYTRECTVTFFLGGDFVWQDRYM